jgi:cyanophycinase
MSPSRVKEGAQRGCIVAIGGAEDKVGDEAILKRFVRLCGGRNARIAVIPTASESRSTGRKYEEVFRELRVEKAWVLPFETRTAERAAVIELVQRRATVAGAAPAVGDARAARH